jgi:anti-anti-sigma regulatory factor
MSKKKPVMSHDPLAGLAEAVTQVAGPEVAQETGMTEAVIVSDADPPTPENENPVTAASGEADAKSATVTLDASLTIAETAALQEVMLTHLRSMTPLCLDASEVEMIDTAGLQLVATAYKTASEKGLEFRIKDPSQKFVQSANQIGLGELLGVQGPAVGA